MGGHARTYFEAQIFKRLSFRDIKEIKIIKWRQ